jgi:hypothetical protein
VQVAKEETLSRYKTQNVTGIRNRRIFRNQDLHNLQCSPDTIGGMKLHGTHVYDKKAKQNITWKT